MAHLTDKRSIIVPSPVKLAIDQRLQPVAQRREQQRKHNHNEAPQQRLLTPYQRYEAWQPKQQKCSDHDQEKQQEQMHNTPVNQPIDLQEIVAANGKCIRKWDEEQEWVCKLIAQQRIALQDVGQNC